MTFQVQICDTSCCYCDLECETRGSFVSEVQCSQVSMVWSQVEIEWQQAFLLNQVLVYCQKGKMLKFYEVLQTTMNMIGALQLLKNKHLKYFYVINMGDICALATSRSNFWIIFGQVHRDKNQGRALFSQVQYFQSFSCLLLPQNHPDHFFHVIML